MFFLGSVRYHVFASLCVYGMTLLFKVAEVLCSVPKSKKAVVSFTEKVYVT